MALTRTGHILTVTEGMPTIPDPSKPNEVVISTVLVVIAADPGGASLPQQNVQFEVPISDAADYVVGSKVTLTVA